MLNKLKFVQGSIAKKGFVPELKHFRIEDGTVRGYNGSLALCAKLGIELTCTPLAEPLIKAIQNCNDESTTKLTLTPTGKLKIKSGKFSALINCIPEEEYIDPHVKPEGERFEFDGEAILEGLKTLTPFIGDDASRPWSNGILFNSQSMFATNNVTAVQYWAKSVFPFVVNLPRDAVKEMVRINEPPTHGQWTDTNITFHYEDGRWIRCQLLTHEWPDIEELLGKVSAKMVEPPEGLFDAIGKLKPFVDKLGRCIFEDGKITTTSDKGEQGAEVEVSGLQGGPIFNVEMLELVGTVAKHIDFSNYPKPCGFYGEHIRGVIVGLKP